MLLRASLCTLVLAAFDLVLATGSTGCSKSFDFPAEVGGAAKGIQIGERRVWVTLPKQYKQSEPAPLIFAFHDKQQTPNTFQEVTKLSDPALNPNAVVLYPEAVEDKWLSDEKPNLKIDDRGLISQLIDGISDRLCIDEERIYATGLGTGAGMVHLLACDPKFAKTMAAFVLVNPLLQSGTVDEKAVKDEISMLWGHCKPGRVPVRLMEIHGANNTKYDYWGKSTEKKQRQRLPTVQWLVEWALRNECGAAEGMPSKDDSEDTFYETTLQAGHIYEGVVFEDKLQRAIYKCTKGLLENEAKSPDDEAGKKIPSLDRLEKVAGAVMLEHFFVRHYDHGWPRITWNGNQPVDMETVELEPSTKTPAFDATREALRWFGMFKLSDDARAPDPKKFELADPLAGLELEALLEQIGAQAEAAERDAENRGSDTTADDLNKGVVTEDLEETVVVEQKGKDEL